MIKQAFKVLLLVIIAAFPDLPPTRAEDRFIIVQSTTSTENSGLFDHILPLFRKKTGIEVRVVAVGTGQAIRNAANGDGDVLLVHATLAEEQFVSQGYGLFRADVMYNDFVIVGPSSDPAGIGGLDNAVTSFRRIAEKKVPFLSRGDDSGTHRTELRLWREAGIDAGMASGTWYREAGSGMGATLNTGINMGAYILTDRATWITFRNKQTAQILVDRAPGLINQYGVIPVSPDRHPHVKAGLARQFVNWILSDEGQAAIASFQINGQPLFFPNARLQEWPTRVEPR